MNLYQTILIGIGVLSGAYITIYPERIIRLKLFIIKCFKTEYPNIGEIWGYESENPFVKPIRIKVIAIEKGWIQYSRNDEIDSCRLEAFIRVYHKIADAEAFELV